MNNVFSVTMWTWIVLATVVRCLGRSADDYAR